MMTESEHDTESGISPGLSPRYRSQPNAKLAGADKSELASLILPKAPSGGNSSTSSSSSSSDHHDKQFWKLIWGAGGIYVSFLYYGSLQEDVFRFTAPDGTKFHHAWFLQILEALSNTVVAYFGRKYSGSTPGLTSIRPFFLSGVSQVSSKAFTSLALASGLSFPVATLAKSGKMAPVMIGQLLLGGSSYTMREYLQVAAIIGGTVLLSLGKKKGSSDASSALGVLFIVLSLTMDGVTAGIQKRLKVQMINDIGTSPKPYEFMLFTSLSMMLTAFTISLLYGDFWDGYAFVMEHGEVRTLIIHFCICSAIGQSFIFYTVAHFDPLVCTTITTTRKILSVLYSIFMKGHVLVAQGYFGLSVAIAGLCAEVEQKYSANKKHHQSSNNLEELHKAKESPLKAKDSNIR